MKLYSQRDLRWAADKIGASNLTVGRWGCCLSSIAMVATYFGDDTNPSELAHNVANYTKDGLIIWQNLRLPTMKFLKRTYGRDDNQIREAIKNPDTAVILQVNSGAHWVVALRGTLIGNSYIVADPWDGTKCDVLKKYHNVSGAAFFARK